MRYEIKAKSACPNCQKETPLFANNIEASDQAEAWKKFKDLHKLCPDCLASGKSAAVDFTLFTSKGFRHFEGLTAFQLQ